MKKILSWEVLVSIAVIAYFIKFLLGKGLIGDSFGMLGVIAVIASYITYKKSKKAEKKD
ncbi:MAG: hypothetical protein WCW04_01175 [Candidatus Paceibacterota bacterium]|jgi:hypothetical protein